MKPLTKLAIVVAFHMAVLLSIVGFKAYASLTTDLVVLGTTTDEPARLVSDDGRDVPRVVYDIALIDRYGPLWDEDAWDTVYVEIREGDDGLWVPVRVHAGRQRDQDGTHLIRGDMVWIGEDRYGAVEELRLGIEDVYIPVSAGASVPEGDGHVVAVEVELDRFGNPTPKRFLIDGEPFPLARR